MVGHLVHMLHALHSRVVWVADGDVLGGAVLRVGLAPPDYRLICLTELVLCLLREGARCGGVCASWVLCA